LSRKDANLSCSAAFFPKEEKLRSVKESNNKEVNFIIRKTGNRTWNTQKEYTRIRALVT